jgi:hypothetical protein
VNTYCFDAEGTLIGQVFEDTDSPSSRTVVGVDCIAQGASDALCEDGPPTLLTSESEAIEVAWFSFFDGGYRFARRLDQLRPEQLELAEAIHVVPPTCECGEDGPDMSVTVTAGDAEQQFAANASNGKCGRDASVVDFRAMNALLATVQCWSAKGYDGRTADAAPSIAPDDGCWHGLFNAHNTSPEWWFNAQIPAAGEYRISLDACGDRSLDLDLFEDDTTTQLGSASGAGGCPLLTHSFESAGSYALRVQMVGGTYAGDFYLSLDSVP